MFMRTDTGKFFTRILMHTQSEILTIYWLVGGREELTAVMRWGDLLDAKF